MLLGLRVHQAKFLKMMHAPMLKQDNGQLSLVCEVVQMATNYGTGSPLRVSIELPNVRLGNSQWCLMAR